MKKLFTMAIMLFGSLYMAVAADYTGSGATPATDGSTQYYLWNVGQKKWLCADADGTLTLGDSPSSTVTITALTTSDTSKDAGYYTITIDGTKITTADGMFPTPKASDSGKNADWLVNLVDNTVATYVLGSRHKYATWYMLYSSASKKITTEAFKLGEIFTDGQWKFVTEDDLPVETVTFDETSTSCSVPSDVSNVHLKRSFTLNNWNTLCVPFSITADELQSQFGTTDNKAEVAEFVGIKDTQLGMKVATSVEAGKPYLVYVSKAGTTVDGETYYSFDRKSTFASEPTDVAQSTSDQSNTVTFTGSFVKTTAPSRSYVFSNSTLYHLTSDMEMKGFRAYFTETRTDSGAKLTLVIDDETTGIITYTDAPAERFDIYNTAGQLVKRNATSTDALPSGVYIVNGKKITK
jgi:hypothetical protein